MAQFIISGFDRVRCIQSPSEDDELYLSNVSEWLLKKISVLEGVPVCDIRLSTTLPATGRICTGNYRVSLQSRLRGGKGGYGTLLRGGGGTARRRPANTDFFRDLEGQRICDTAMIRRIQQTLEERQQSLSESSSDRGEGDQRDNSEEEVTRKQQLNAERIARQEKLARMQKAAREELNQAAERGLGNSLKLAKESTEGGKIVSIYGDVCNFEDDEDSSSDEESVKSSTDGGDGGDTIAEEEASTNKVMSTDDMDYGLNTSEDVHHGVKRSFSEVGSGIDVHSLESIIPSAYEQRRKRVLVLDK